MECKYCGIEHPKKEKNNPFFCMEQMTVAIEKKDAEIAALTQRVKKLTSENNLLKSDLKKVEDGYDEISLRREETVAMCEQLRAERRSNALDGQATMDEAYARIKGLEATNAKYEAFWNDSRLEDKQEWEAYVWPKHLKEN